MSEDRTDAQRDGDAAARKAVETIYRMERARLIGGLVKLTRDLDRAEELAQEAMLQALALWPRQGVPASPGAWLTTVARRKAIDGARREAMQARKQTALDVEAEAAAAEAAAAEARAAATEAPFGADTGDEQLSLMFIACHPALSREARAALTLRLIGGLTTGEIARAFLATEAAIGQRITRAKKTLRESGAEFAPPEGPARRARLASVLEAIYLIFNEGYAATAGDRLFRSDLCQEAMRLGRILAATLPEEPEVFGLLALMEIQASRLSARETQEGDFIPITEQNRARWDRLLIQRGLSALARAEALGGADGPYALQAALGACHARAARPEETDWAGMTALYDRLLAVAPSPIVALNRAIACSMAFGPDAGLADLQTLEAAPALRSYAPLPAARAHMLFRAGRFEAARAAFESAAALSANSREKAFLLKRARECGDVIQESVGQESGDRESGDREAGG